MPYTAQMERASKPRSGVALGGIGTGGIELRADGLFHNWQIFNNAPFGTGARLPLATDSLLFFVVRYQEAGGRPRMKVLQIDEGENVAAILLHHYSFPWLTGVDRTTYEAQFPFVRMTFSDAQMPFTVELEAFSPFIPHDLKHSALPAALFRFRIASHSDRPVDVMLMASLRNAAGYDVRDRVYHTAFEQTEGAAICEMGCDGMAGDHPSYGTQALASVGETSYYLGWEHIHPYYEIVLRNGALPNIDDTAGRNVADPATGQVRAMERLWSTLAASRRLGPGEAFEHRFVTAWHFPNQYSEDHGEAAPRRLEGVYYSNFFASAADVARYVVARRDDLERRTCRSTEAFYDSSLDGFALDTVNAQLNTFVTSAWLTRAGDFGIQEGLNQTQSWGPLATVDVGLYGGVAALALFPELERATLRAYARLQDESGMVSHGISRHFACAEPMDWRTSRLDLPAQFAIEALRTALFTGDDDFLREIWPAVRAALEYVLRERDLDGDGLPDMTGIMCSYDNFPMYGASAYVGSLWLSALGHALEAARALGDADAQGHYGDVLAKGREAFESKLWNGEYYRLFNDTGGAHGTDEGCLTDQVIGQWCNDASGLGDLADRERVRSALRSVLRHSFDPEYGLRNCRWPDDGWLHDIAPDIWVDQSNTCWSGVELAFAALLAYEDMPGEALRVVRTVDERHRKSGMYFDHYEFGGHYYRAMSAWSLVNAFLGLSVRRGRFRFAPKIGGDAVRLFFAGPEGTAHYAHDRAAATVTLAVVSGALSCRELVFALPWSAPARLALWLDGERVPDARFVWVAEADGVAVRFVDALALREGQTLRVQFEGVVMSYESG